MRIPPQSPDGVIIAPTAKDDDATAKTGGAIICETTDPHSTVLLMASCMKVIEQGQATQKVFPTLERPPVPLL